MQQCAVIISVKNNNPIGGYSPADQPTHLLRALHRDAIAASLSLLGKNC
jgi:hypothetical protein